MQRIRGKVDSTSYTIWEAGMSFHYSIVMGVSVVTVLIVVEVVGCSWRWVASRPRKLPLVMADGLALVTLQERQVRPALFSVLEAM